MRDRAARSITARSVPQSHGFYEQLDCDVVHFPYQTFTACALPTIYNPHDLQHLHYPQFFTPSAIARREATYSAGCRLAHTVAVAARCVKQDIIHHYGVHPRKIQVIPWSAPTEGYPEPTTATVAEIRGRYRLEKCFALYPAVTWPHKNHLRLLEALALCRGRLLQEVNLVCTGYQTHFWREIRDRILALGLRDQVKFLGVLPPTELRALYRLAQFVVIPTLFEGACLPLFEAWQDNAAVTCSSVAPVSEVAGGAVLFFDPHRVESIAAALVQMATDPKLRDALRQRGARQLKEFSWRRCAKTYRAVYRRAAGMPITDEDRWLLNYDQVNQVKEPQCLVEARL
jgi:glycosyltransferase involved in cell wall biosynthesis